MRLICLLLILCCGKHEEPKIVSVPPPELATKVGLYCDLSKEKYERYRYIGNECDSLLYTSLHGLVCGYVSIDQFESTVEPGQWFRNPEKNCLARGESDSDISKDMLLGAMIFWEVRGDANPVRRTIAYGESRNWYMNDAKDDFTANTKTLLLPTGRKLLRDIESSITLNTVYPTEEQEPVDNPLQNVGPNAHLEVLGLLMRGKLSGLNQFEVILLREQSRRSPRNAVFKAAYASYDDGDMTPVDAVLMNESFFPNDRLPNNHNNQCTPYLWERDDEPSDWSPCPDATYYQHSGTDFLLAAYIRNGGFLKK